MTSLVGAVAFRGNARKLLTRWCGRKKPARGEKLIREARERRATRKSPQRAYSLAALFFLSSLYGVFRVAQRFAGATLRLVHLAFGLQFLVVHHPSGGVLHGTFSLVRGALHMFLVHNRLLRKRAHWWATGALPFKPAVNLGVPVLKAKGRPES